jgi:hypothetical protein
MASTGERNVLLVHGDERRTCQLGWRSAWDDHRLELDGPEGMVVGTGPDQFEALVAVRRTLEKTGWLIAVQGARRDTYPSGMARDMGQGHQVYICRPGCAANREDLVGTLDDAEIEKLATVDEQRRYFEAWLGKR